VTAELTSIEQDALIEICNIGVSQAARQLSSILQDEIQISVPEVSVVDYHSLADTLNLEADSKVSCVTQQLTGSLRGQATLLFHNTESHYLINALLGHVSQVSSIKPNDFDHEAVSEVGNIIISACISAISNLLSEKVGFSMPSYQEGEAMAVFQQACQQEGDDVMVTIVVSTLLKAAKRDVNGMLILAFTLPSVDVLVEGIQNMLRGVEVKK